MKKHKSTHRQSGELQLFGNTFSGRFDVKFVLDKYIDKDLIGILNVNLNKNLAQGFKFSVQKFSTFIFCILFLALGLFQQKDLFASRPQAPALCRSYFGKMDLLQSFTDSERAALTSMAATFARLQGQADAASLDVKSHLQEQLTAFQEKKKLSSEQREDFAMLFQDSLPQYKLSTELAKRKEAQRALSVRERKVKQVQQQQQIRKILRRIFRKYGVNTLDEALVESCTKQSFLHEIIDLNLSEIQFLLKSGANVDYINQAGASALYRAIQAQSIPAINILLQAGANIEISYADKVTPFLLASMLGYLGDPALEIVKLLHAAGAKLDVVDMHGRSPQILASEGGSLEILQFLMSKDENLNIKSDMYAQALHAVISRRDGSRIESFLIDAGVNIDMFYRGRTALMHAAGYNKAKTVQMLLDAGADISLKTPAGLTVFDFAKNIPEIKKILEEHLQSEK